MNIGIIFAVYMYDNLCISMEDIIESIVGNNYGYYRDILGEMRVCDIVIESWRRTYWNYLYGYIILLLSDIVLLLYVI